VPGESLSPSECAFKKDPAAFQVHAHDRLAVQNDLTLPFTTVASPRMMNPAGGETFIPPASQPQENKVMAKKSKVKSAAKKKPAAKKKK
jgi:hypothetical protein